MPRKKKLIVSDVDKEVKKYADETGDSNIVNLIMSSLSSKLEALIKDEISKATKNEKEVKPNKKKTVKKKESVVEKKNVNDSYIFQPKTSPTLGTKDSRKTVKDGKEITYTRSEPIVANQKFIDTGEEKETGRKKIKYPKRDSLGIESRSKTTITRKCDDCGKLCEGNPILLGKELFYCDDCILRKGRR